MPNPAALDLIQSVFAGIYSPYLGSRIISQIPKMIAIYLNYKRYPKQPDMNTLKKWSLISAACGGFKSDLKNFI